MVAVVDIDLRHRIAGVDPPLRDVVGVVRIVGLLGTLVLLGVVDAQPAVALTEGVDGRALALERVLHRIANRHRHDERAVGVERILSLVTAVALRAADHRRGHVEHHLGAFAQQNLARFEAAFVLVLLVIGLAERQRVAHRQTRTLNQRRVDFAAVAVIGHIVRIFGEGAGQLGIHLPTRQDDVAAQVAPREVKLHPANRIVDGCGILVAHLQHVDVVAAILLQVLLQVGTVEAYPRGKRHLLVGGIGFALLLGT